MNDPASVHRQLKIKSGVVNRLLKENKLYVKECEQQRVKVDKLVADGAEGWDVRNGRKMLEESEKMIEDSKERLGKAVADLRELVVPLRADLAYENDSELQTAESVLGTVNVEG